MSFWPFKRQQSHKMKKSFWEYDVFGMEGAWWHARKEAESHQGATLLEEEGEGVLVEWTDDPFLMHVTEKESTLTWIND